MDIHNYKLPVVPKDHQMSHPVGHGKGEAFGVSVEASEGVPLATGVVSDSELYSFLFPKNQNYATDKGFVMVLDANQLQELRCHNAGVFSDLYSATPLEAPKENLFSRVLTVVSGTLSAYFRGQ